MSAVWVSQQLFVGNTTATNTITTNTTTDTTENDADVAQRSFVQYAISDVLQKAVIPVLLLLGTFGNVMTVVVMRALRAQFGDPSMAVYFPCLAVCDQAVLTLGLGRKWTRNVFLHDVRLLHAAVCKLHKFLVLSLSRMAAWILVAVTSQRVLTVTWPMRQRATDTKKRAQAVVLVIVAVCCLLDSGILVVYHPQTSNGETKCQPVKDSSQAAFYQDMVVPWLNSVTGSWLPFVILVVNNAILGYSVRKSVKASRHLTDSQQADTRRKQATSLSITLIVTSLTFILLTSPIPATFFIQTFSPSSPSSDGTKREADLVLADVVLDLLSYSNSAVNFYLYFLTGPTFRQQARRLLCWGRQRRPHGHFSSRTGTISPSSTSLPCPKDSAVSQP